MRALELESRTQNDHLARFVFGLVLPLSNQALCIAYRSQMSDFMDCCLYGLFCFMVYFRSCDFEHRASSLGLRAMEFERSMADQYV